MNNEEKVWQEFEEWRAGSEYQWVSGDAVKLIFAGYAAASKTYDYLIEDLNHQIQGFKESQSAVRVPKSWRQAAVAAMSFANTRGCQESPLCAKEHIKGLAHLILTLTAAPSIAEKENNDE